MDLFGGTDFGRDGRHDRGRAEDGEWAKRLTEREDAGQAGDNGDSRGVRADEREWRGVRQPARRRLAVPQPVPSRVVLRPLDPPLRRTLYVHHSEGRPSAPFVAALTRAT